MNIDLHTHVIPQSIIDAFAAEPDVYGTKVETRDGKKYLNRGGNPFELAPVYYNVDAKLEAMDRMGLDVAVISTGPPAYCYWVPGEKGAHAARLVNDGIALMVDQKPARFRGMATLPMQDVDAAMVELERVAKEYKFKGVEIATAIEGVLLADARFRPLLRRIEQLGMFVFTHPYLCVAKGGMDNYYLSNLVGFPLDTTLMVAHLMYSGALDELKTLRFVLPHGGGYVPYQIGRFVHGHKVRTETQSKSKTSPFELLKRFTIDTLTHFPQSTRHLIDTVGADHVVLGSDCPFDMAEVALLKALDAVPRITVQEKEQICSLTALKLLGER